MINTYVTSTKKKKDKKKTYMSKSQNTFYCRRIPPLTSELVSSMSLMVRSAPYDIKIEIYTMDLIISHKLR